MADDSRGQAGANQCGEITLSEFGVSSEAVEAGVVFLRRSGRLEIEIEGADQALVEGLLHVCLGTLSPHRETNSRPCQDGKTQSRVISPDRA